MNFKNMKIKIENNLDEIMGELKNQGYKQAGCRPINDKWIVTSEVGLFIGVDRLTGHKGLSLTTLAELKGMLDESNAK